MHRYQGVCGAANAALKETSGQVENRLQRGVHCLDRLKTSLKEIGLIESAIQDVKMDIEREGAASLKDSKNCLVTPGRVKGASGEFVQMGLK